MKFHFSASWLNQVEGWFGILGKQSLSTTGFDSKATLKGHLAAYPKSWNSWRGCRLVGTLHRDVAVHSV